MSSFSLLEEGEYFGIKWKIVRRHMTIVYIQLQDLDVNVCIENRLWKSGIFDGWFTIEDDDDEFESCKKNMLKVLENLKQHFLQLYDVDGEKFKESETKFFNL